MWEKNDTWIIDSGCSHHMTGDKTKFENFEDYDGGSVRFGNNEPCCIKGRGRISLTKECKDPPHMYLSNMNPLFKTITED